MIRLVLIAFAFALTATIACGGTSSSEDAAPGAARGAGADSPGPAPGVKVVPHETLQTFLPTLDGWTRGELKGETDAGDGVSRAQAEYEKPGSALTITIMDTSKNPDLLAQMNEPTPGYSKTTVAGYPGVQEWTDAVKNGDVQILVGGRYTVSVNGNAVTDVAMLRSILEGMDLKRLAGLN